MIFKIYEGYDWHNDVPLYQVIGTNNDYAGEWHNHYEDAELELEGLQMESKKTLQTFWQHLGDTPIDEDETIEKPVKVGHQGHNPWHTFPIGTHRQEIWSWIEDQWKVSVHSLMFPSTKIF